MNEFALITYAGLTAVVITIEHFTFGRWWKRNELARRTLAHATILGLALPFVPAGLIDLMTLTAIAIATGVAGAITAGLYIHENEQRNRARIEDLRQQAAQYDDEPTA